MNTSWDDTKADPIKDVRTAIELIKKQSYNPKLISLKEALNHDTQILYLAGYNNDQINEYIELAKESYNKSLNQTSLDNE